MKSVNHHRKFFCLFCANTFFNCAGMRTMRNTSRMQSNHTSCNIFAAHEIAVNIIDNFIAVDVTVIIGRRNTLRMIIEKSRHKTAYNKIVCLKSLMHRRRLMHTTGDGLKVVNAERERITTSIPSNNIKRMMTIMNVIHATFLLCANYEISFLIKRYKIKR